MFTKLVVLVPTRNRGEMACRSAQSVKVAAIGPKVEVIISDNSTDASEAAAIDAFLAQHSTLQISVIRPNSPLPMTEHWQWCIEQALSIRDSSHFFILTDRMLFKEGALRTLLAIVEKYPEDLVSFTYDRVDDYARPISFLPLPRTGHLYRMNTTDLLHQTARMVFHSCLPRMLNCVAPRSDLERIEQVYGSVFSSAAPDYCFCYRVLGLIPSMLYYDKSLLVNYAQGRSNGASFARGIATKDSADFERNLNAAEYNNCVPVPAIRTVGNAVIQEYCSVRVQRGDSRYPELALDAYLDFLASEIDAFVDPGVRSVARDVLAKNGWHATFAFRLRTLKSKLLMRMLSMRKRRFKSLDGAIRYATAHRSKSLPWIGYVHRRYGKQTVPLP